MTVYDPLVDAVPGGVFPEAVRHAPSLESALSGAAAALL